MAGQEIPRIIARGKDSGITRSYVSEKIIIPLGAVGKVVVPGGVESGRTVTYRHHAFRHFQVSVAIEIADGSGGTGLPEGLCRI